MRNALDLLVDLGAWTLPAIWLPVLVWTVAAFAAEAVLRVRPPHALLALGVRRAVLWALPVGIVAALALPSLLPDVAVEQVIALRPQPFGTFVLPTLEVGVAPEAGTLVPEPVPLGPLTAGLAFLAIVTLAVVRLGAVVGGLASLQRLSSGTAHEVVQRETEAAARAAGVARDIRAVATAVPTVPFTFGWRRPVIVVPAELTDDPESLRLVLAHEVAHIARGDFAAGVAERVLTAVFGWHPLIGALARRVDLDRERATDAAVLAGHPSRRRDYASLLLSFSRLPSPALALGAAPGSHSLTTRITDMNASPLSADRLRRLTRTARALGIALFVVAVGAAAFLAIGPSQTRALAASLGADGILLDHPSVLIDGIPVMEGDGVLSSPSFALVNVAVGGWGRFLVSDQPFEGASPAGSFTLDRLNVQAGGHSLRMDLESPPFEERHERRAYARFDAFPDAAPLREGDARLDEVWFSISSRFDDPMPLRATYRDRMMDADEPIMTGDVMEAIEAPMESVIEGQVRDAVTGEPLVGASVQVVGTKVGAATDTQGRFVITGVDPGDAQVRVTFVGYEPLVVVPQPGERLRIGLVPTDAETRRERLREMREEAQQRAREIDPDSPQAPEVFEVVEEMPRMNGGLADLQQRLVYPAEARAAGIEGKVFIQFVVNETGGVQDATCARSPNVMLCDAAIAAVEATSFTPGHQRGRAVKVRYTLPVDFKLPASE